MMEDKNNFVTSTKPLPYLRELWRIDINTSPELDSKKYHISFTDLDMAVLGPYEDRPNGHGYWFLIEHKQYRHEPTDDQWRLIEIIDSALRKEDSQHFLGYHLIQEEKMTVHDVGYVYFDGIKLLKEDYYKALRIEFPEYWYKERRIGINDKGICRGTIRHPAYIRDEEPSFNFDDYLDDLFR